MAYTGSKAQIGLGTQLLIGASPGTLVGELKDKIGITGRKMGTEETTNFESSFEEFLSTLPAGGSWTISGNYVSGDAGRLLLEIAYATPGVLTAFTVQMPKAAGQSTKGDSFTFSAIVEDLNYDISLKKAITFTCTLKVSGGVTLVAGS